MNKSVSVADSAAHLNFFSTLKWKLILASVLCTAAVSLFGNLFLYYRMNTY